MGGQACVLYGAAEFSKDFDFALLLTEANLEKFSSLTAELEARVIAVPPFEPGFLEKGHAVHFRASLAGFEQLRIDIMTKMRGVDPFPALWGRRTTAEIDPGMTVELLSLPDLVQAKKTQRDKDWPMIRRLVDVDYLQHRSNATPAQVLFWLKELRTPSLLIECASTWKEIVTEIAGERSAILLAAMEMNVTAVELALDQERAEIRQLDRLYWAPLLKELEMLRHKRKE